MSRELCLSGFALKTGSMPLVLARPVWRQGARIIARFMQYHARHETSCCPEHCVAGVRLVSLSTRVHAIRVSTYGVAKQFEGG